MDRFDKPNFMTNWICIFLFSFFFFFVLFDVESLKGSIYFFYLTLESYVLLIF